MHNESAYPFVSDPCQEAAIHNPFYGQLSQLTSFNARLFAEALDDLNNLGADALLGFLGSCTDMGVQDTMGWLYRALLVAGSSA